MPRKLSKVRNPYDFVDGLPRMSWAPDNLFNLFRNSFGPEVTQQNFKRSSRTLFQQRWQAKTLARGYHGDWLPEKRLKHHFLPAYLPHPTASAIARKAKEEAKNLRTGRYADRNPAPRSDRPIPLTGLMWTELERRLDVLVFRANFAPSIYAARHLVVHGRVRVNGIKESNPNVKLEPGALFSVDPVAIRMLHIPADVEKAKQAKLAPAREAEESAKTGESSAEATSEGTEDVETAVEEVGGGSAPAQPSASSSKPTRFDTPHKARLDHLGGAEKIKDGEEWKVGKSAEQRRVEAAAAAYLEVSYETCSAVFVRLPTARPGRSEIPSPFDADGEVMKFTLEWYAQMNKRLHRTPRTPGPYRIEFERTGLHGHGGALVAEHLAKQRKPGETFADRAKRLQTRQREVMDQARQHALSKLPPHLLAKSHPSESRSA